MNLHQLGLWRLIPVSLALFSSNQSVAQDNITVGGQIRPRSEFRDPVGGTMDTFTSMRIRANVTATPDRNVTAFIQLQDVRLWGEETNTLGDFNADNIDLHQGYADFKMIGGAPVALRIGRQELSLGGQRLIGAAGWTQQARSFDGLKLSLTPEKGRVDVIGFRTAEGTGGTNPTDASLLGIHGIITAMQNASLDLYTFYNHVTGANTNEVTIGARYAANRPRWMYRLESTFQTGERGGQDVTAFMFGARFGHKIKDKGAVALWYDYLSGDDDPTDGKAKVFNTLFAANHKFYGFYDLFLNIPVHTAGLGLQDIALKTSATPHKDLTLRFDFHSFLLAKKGTQTSSHLGEEVDFTLIYRYANGISFTGGVSFVIQDDALAGIGRLTQNAGWGYLMTNVAF